MFKDGWGGHITPSRVGAYMFLVISATVFSDFWGVLESLVSTLFLNLGSAGLFPLGIRCRTAALVFKHNQLFTFSCNFQDK